MCDLQVSANINIMDIKLFILYINIGLSMETTSVLRTDIFNFFLKIKNIINKTTLRAVQR